MAEKQQKVKTVSTEIVKMDRVIDMDNLKEGKNLVYTTPKGYQVKTVVKNGKLVDLAAAHEGKEIPVDWTCESESMKEKMKMSETISGTCCYYTQNQCVCRPCTISM